jgi:hypothetical protein
MTIANNNTGQNSHLEIQPRKEETLILMNNDEVHLPQFEGVPIQIRMSITIVNSNQRKNPGQGIQARQEDKLISLMHNSRMIEFQFHIVPT